MQDIRNSFEILFVLQQTFLHLFCVNNIVTKAADLLEGNEKWFANNYF